MPKKDLIVTAVEINLTRGGKLYRALITLSNGDTYERTDYDLNDLFDSIKAEFVGG